MGRVKKVQVQIFIGMFVMLKLFLVSYECCVSFVLRIVIIVMFEVIEVVMVVLLCFLGVWWIRLRKELCCVLVQWNCQFIYLLVWVCIVGFVGYSVGVQWVVRQCRIVFDFYSIRLFLIVLFLIVGIIWLGFIVRQVLVKLNGLLMLICCQGWLIFLVSQVIFLMLCELSWFQSVNIFVLVLVIGVD